MSASLVRVADWAVISPLGSGKQDFTRAVNQRRAARQPVRVSARGGVDRLSALAIATADQLLGPVDVTTEMDRLTAVTLGTSTGSLTRLVEMAHDSHSGRRGHDIRPMSIPSMVPNAAAGQIAIHRRISGPNTTVAAGPASGLHALSVAARTIRLGHAERAIAGAVEERSYARAKADLLTRSALERASAPLADACALFRLERTDRPTGTILLGARYGFSNGGKGPQRDTLVRLIRALLDDNGLHPDAIDHVQLSQPESQPLREVEHEAVHASLLGRSVPEFTVADMIGDAHSATGALQAGAALAMSGRHRLITSLGVNGEVAVMLLSHTAEEKE